MNFAKPYSGLIIIAILILIVAIAIPFDLPMFWCESNVKEGLDIIPLEIDPKTQKIVKGYYQVDEKNMAMIPYGFGIDPNDQKKIIPITKVGISILTPRYNPPLPKEGEQLTKGFYFISDSSLAMLPPNMSPNIESIDFSGNPPKLLIKYGVGYVSDTQYYKNIYRPINTPEKIPKEVYYLDPAKTQVSFLQYGEIQDMSNGYGKIVNAGLNMKDFNYINSKYKDISGNYNIMFHNDVEEIKKQNDMYDLSFGEVRVKDQNGNILILPRVESQERITYYQPGEFRFGASTYIPNYEDSVYLSRVTNRTMFGNSQPNQCDDACKAYNEFKTKMDKYYS
jgi:hypothetical protein